MAQARNAGGTQDGSDRGAKERVKQKADEVSHKASDAMDQAKHAAGDVAHKAGDAVDQAKHAAEDVAHKAEEKASELAHEAGRMATSQAEQQKVRVAQGIHTVADALRRGSSDLPPDEREYSTYVTRLADGVDRVSGYIEGRDVRELGRDVERFARDNATAFIGGAFALGVLSARFVKSSGSEGRRENLPMQYSESRHDLPSHMEQGRYVPPTGSTVRSEVRGGGYA